MTLAVIKHKIIIKYYLKHEHEFIGEVILEINVV
jgi:hypothetical protein